MGFADYSAFGPKHGDNPGTNVTGAIGLQRHAAADFCIEELWYQDASGFLYGQNPWARAVFRRRVARPWPSFATTTMVLEVG